jgi:hypothetical protein
MGRLVQLVRYQIVKNAIGDPRKLMNLLFQVCIRIIGIGCGLYRLRLKLSIAMLAKIISNSKRMVLRAKPILQLQIVCRIIIKIQLATFVIPAIF